MNQLSKNGESVQLEIISGQLLFIDPIYFDDVAEAYEEVKLMPRFDTKAFIQLIEQKVFEYGGGSLLGLKSVNLTSKVYELEIASIKIFNPDDNETIEQEAIEKKITAFGLDSASLLIIDMANFDALIPLLNSEELFDKFDKGYIDKINTQLGNRGWAFILSPGVEQGYEFEGDGSFTVGD